MVGQSRAGLVEGAEAHRPENGTDPYGDPSQSYEAKMRRTVARQVAKLLLIDLRNKIWGPARTGSSLLGLERAREIEDEINTAVFQVKVGPFLEIRARGLK